MTDKDKPRSILSALLAWMLMIVFLVGVFYLAAPSHAPRFGTIDLRVPLIGVFLVWAIFDLFQVWRSK